MRNGLADKGFGRNNAIHGVRAGHDFIARGAHKVLAHDDVFIVTGARSPLLDVVLGAVVDVVFPADFALEFAKY